jgi:hypothetical protein
MNIDIPVWILWTLGIISGGIVLMLALLGAFALWTLLTEE